MKLTSLYIEDFRQFNDFRLDFTNPATGQPLEKVCFIGPNGTGKSTLLEFLSGPATRRASKATARKKQDAIIESAEDDESKTTLINYCPPETEPENKQKIPKTSLGRALTPSRPVFGAPHNVISTATAAKFWENLIRLITRRQKLQDSFRRLPENANKTIAQADVEFDLIEPPILNGLAKVWDSILLLSDLEFDHASVQIPFNATENLEAYLRTRRRKHRVTYDQLSTGIRHYIFRLGHIWSLYFNRPPGDSILLVDEPEGSLYPDFLYDIVENYREVAPGCQLFMATHSPIVASQFKPEERFILTFGDDGYVHWRRGTSPEGDDPNDILRQDFGVGSLMTEVGERAWERFLELRRLIPAAEGTKRTAYIEEYTRLGTAYHFPVPGGHNGNGS